MMRLNILIQEQRAVKGVLLLLFGAFGFLGTVGTAQAQNSAPAGTTASGLTRLSRITVTGSHIPRTSIVTAQPVIRISRQQIDASGFQTVEQLLMNLSTTGPSLTRQINNGNEGAGYETVNLHDLGRQRVLVLVNGKRWITTLSGFVDLNTIPLSIIDHIEVLLNGASAIYGSEAIAGVINLVTIKNYNGANVSAYLGGYDAHGVGGGFDGKTQQYSFTVGTSGDKSAVLLSAGYYKQDPVWKGNRTISKTPFVGFGVYKGSPDSGRFRVLLTGAGNTPNGCSGSPGSVCDINSPDPNDPSGFHKWSVLDNFNNKPFNYLLQPSERWYTYVQGHYDLTNNVSFHFTTTYQRRNSVQDVSFAALQLGLTGNNSANGQQIGVSANAPGNPFGVDLVPYSNSSPQFSAWCARFGSPNCSTQYDELLSVVRPTGELGPRYFIQNVNTFYFNGGFNGFFGLFNNQWQWNVDYIYSQTLATDVKKNFSDTVKVQEALSYGCASDPSCVPMDIFGRGGISPAAANFVSLTGHDNSETVLRDYAANIAGNFWNSWYAGPWGVALGYEYDELGGFSQPDALFSTGNVNANSSKPTSGRENTNAQYAELNIPLARDMFLAKDLSIDLAQRFSQFHWVGNGNVFNSKTAEITTIQEGKYAHSSTPRVTFKWQPINDILIRGSWSQAFRIPSVSELFQGASQNEPGVNDPCALNPSTTPRSELPPGCNGHFHIQQGSQIRTIVGGNAQLQPEKSLTRTIGFVVSPRVVPGFNFSADYYKSEVTNLIQTAGPQYWLDSCYIDQNPQSCARVQVAGSGDNTTVTSITDLNENGGSQKVEGWDLSANYRLPVTSIGTFSVHLEMNFMQKDVICLPTGICQDIAGTVGPTVTGATGSHSAQRGAQPKHRYQFRLGWNYGSWSAHWNVYVIGPVWENCAFSRLNGRGLTFQPGVNPVFGWCSKIISFNSSHTRITKGVNRLGTTIYNDVQASYTVSAWNATFTLGIDNLFDKVPPIGRDVFENGFYPSPYRLPGRFIYGRIRVQF